MNREAIYNKVAGCLLGGLIGDAMGAPVEGWTYERIETEHGFITEFTGAGTDDSAVKTLLCRAILAKGGHITADDLADVFLANPQQYRLYYVPVRNMYHKLESGVDLPVNAGYNNAPSSSSAMAISPMGIINLCDPRGAAREAYEVAGLIHSGSTSFCRDGASAMAAAVAEAMRPGATVASIVENAVAHLHQTSAALLIGLIQSALALAKKHGEYAGFRRDFYAEYLRPAISDSRETIPATLALFYLSDGDVEKSIQYAVNFGRDADTIASMVGSVAGAYRGLSNFPEGWVEKAYAENEGQKKLAADMTDIAVKRAGDMAAILNAIEGIG